MNLKSSTQQVLLKYGILPNKRLGQNFLIDKNTINLLIKTAKITKADIILEVGAGTGNITKELAKHAKQVIAVEKDIRLVKLLQNELSHFKNLEIIYNDILKLKIKNLKFHVVGAPPYYLTARLFRKFFEESENKPKSITLLIQKGVAERIVAQPPNSNILRTSIAFYGTSEIKKIISKNAFWPIPKVDSAILSVSDIKTPNVNEKLFFQIVKAGFSSPRKQILSNLTKKLKLNRKDTRYFLEKIGIDPASRAQTLTIENWVKLTELLK